MRILFIGDIFGRPGRVAIKHFVPFYKQNKAIDLVIANGENAKHGSGITLSIYEELAAAGVDWITGGNHSFSAKEFMPFLDDKKIKVIRPANYPHSNGQGMVTFTIKKQQFTLINLLGRVFIREYVDNPFMKLDELLGQAKGFVFVDFHAESTSEKVAMGLYADGRVGAVVGTHTHVQTADERILPQGTAFITDVGMTGPSDGIIGTDYDAAIKIFTKALPTTFEPAAGRMQFNAVIIETKGKKAVKIERVFEIIEE